MADRKSDLFDYEGFLQECKQNMDKWGYSIQFTSRCIGMDDSSVSHCFKHNTIGWATAVGLSSFLDVSLDKYVKAA